MLTQTSELAIKALIFLGSRGDGKPVSPRVIAEALACSPTYLAKTLGLLARAGIVRAQRGAHGGAQLAREPAGITLLDIVEACQGIVVGNYCRALGHENRAGVCAFHQAMIQVYEATVGTLRQWTLEALIARPRPDGRRMDRHLCKMHFPGISDTAAAKSPAGRRSSRGTARRP